MNTYFIIAKSGMRWQHASSVLALGVAIHAVRYSEDPEEIQIIVSRNDIVEAGINFEVNWDILMLAKFALYTLRKDGKNVVVSYP
jgi:hypothetical protein